MKNKLLCLWVLLAGLCGAVEVRLMSMSGKTECELKLDLSAQSGRDIYAQCMTAANKIINRELVQPLRYPFIRNAFKLVTPTGGELEPAYFDTISDEQAVELSLVREHKEIMVLPLENEDENVTLVFESRGNQFVNESLEYNICSCYFSQNQTFEVTTIEFLRRLDDPTVFSKCILIQKLADSQYVKVELSFEPIDGCNYDLDASRNVFNMLLIYLYSSYQEVLPDISHLKQEHLGLFEAYNYDKSLSEQSTLNQQWKLGKITRSPYSPLYHENIPL